MDFQARDASICRYIGPDSEVVRLVKAIPTSPLDSCQEKTIL